jgi:hypothetical protein
MGMLRRSGVAAAIGLGILGGAGLFAQPAHAEFIVTIVQDGSDVVVTGSGTIDLTGLTFVRSDSFISGIWPSEAVLGIGAPGGEAVDVYTGFTGPPNFGTGGSTVPSDSGSGDKVAVEEPTNELVVPEGYVSGTSLSDSSTYDNATFTSLGLTPGTYTYTWNTPADSFVIEVGGSSAVPEPANLSLLAAALAMTLVAARCRRRA